MGAFRHPCGLCRVLPVAILSRVVKGFDDDVSIA